MKIKFNVKKLYDTRKKVYILSIVGILLIVSIIGLIISANAKKTVLKDVELSFNGYSGHGYATTSGDKLVDNIIKTTGSAAGIDEKTINEVVNTYDNNNGNVLTNSYGQFSSPVTSINTLSSDKLNNWREWFKDTTYSLNNNSNNLKNGDKVVLKIKTTQKNNPIKNETKTYTVHGLKKPETKNTSEVFNNLKVSFSGVSGKGNLNITSKTEQYQTKVKVSKSENLSNGDKVKVTLPTSLLDADSSKIYTGSRTREYAVSGLSDLSAISNLSEVTDFANAIINKNKMDSENYTFKGIYVSQDSSSQFNNSDNESNKGEYTVQSPEYRSSSSNDEFTLSVLYEEKTDYSFYNKTTTSYRSLSLNDVPLKDNKFDLSKISSSSAYPSTLSADTLELAQHDMATKGQLLN